MGSSSSCTDKACWSPRATPRACASELEKLQPMREFGYELPDDLMLGRGAARARAGSRRRGRGRLRRPGSTGTCVLSPSPRRGRRCAAVSGSRSSRAPRSSTSLREGNASPRAAHRRRRLPGRRRRSSPPAPGRRRCSRRCSASRLPIQARQGVQLHGRRPRSCRATRSCWPTCTSAAPRSARRCGSAARWSSAASTFTSTAAASTRTIAGARASFREWARPEVDVRMGGDAADHA